MLETPKERVALLKAGIDGKTIENLYILHNNIKIIQLAEANDQINLDAIISKEAAVELSLKQEILESFTEIFQVTD